MTDYLDSELYLPSLDRACFTWEGERNYEGKPALDYERALEISALENEPEAYGRELYDAVLPPESDLRKGFLEALFAAELAKSSLRFRLRLSPDLPAWVHALYWELLTDPDPRRGAFARSPKTAFSRYSSLPQALGEPIGSRPRLLCVVSAPSDIARFGMAEIDRGEVLGRFETLSSELAGEVEVEVLEPPATLGRLRERLMQGGVHLLHFFGHGDSRGGGSALFLEDEQGRTKPVPEEMLAKLFLGAPELRLVTLIACHGGAPSSHDPFSGLAGRLVQHGLPAVLAMRRAVSFETGHVFTGHFYRHLARTRRFDAAVNEARNQLYLAKPQGIDWSSPVLYSRLKDGRLWLTEEDAGAGSPEDSVPLLRLAPRRLRHPLPWVPALIALLLVLLGLFPAWEAEARFDDLWASQLSFQLARSSRVVESLDLEEIATAQLAALRLPSMLPAPSQWGGGGGRRRKGFFLRVSGPGSQVTLNPQPFPKGSRITLEHQEGQLYRLSITRSPQELTATFRGDVELKPLDGSSALLHLEHPESLDLYPQSGAVGLDLVFSRFAPDAFSREIPIDDLSLRRVIEQHDLGETQLKEESTVLAGKIHLLVTDRRHPLRRDESIDFSSLAGSLTGLRLGKDGIRVGFQGRISGLERAAPGLEPESLMPSILDSWIAGPAQRPVHGATGTLAAVVLLLTVLEIRPLRRRARMSTHS